MIPHVPVASSGLVASAAMISRWRGNYRVTAIAKATFSFVPGGEMTLAHPVEIAVGDVHAAKNPMRSVRASNDVCPHLERADVLFVGRAHAPRGEAVPAMRVRLAVADDTRPLLDKRLEIVGERAMHPGAPPSSPTPFQNMVIAYEKALGGLGRPDNPLGVGAGVDSKLLPNVFYADPALADRVAGYGPLAATWPVRKKLLRGKGRPPIEGVMELPDDFDWSYFQAAPIDQQMEALPPRAWILLEGLSPRAEQVQMRLPAVKTIARLFGVGDEPSLPLRADTLFIDGDAEHCTVSFRGSFQVPSLEILQNAWIGVAIEAPGHPATWPSRPMAGSATAAAAPRASSATVAIDEPLRPISGPAGNAFAGTMIIEEPVPVAAHPFAGKAPPPGPAPKAPAQHSGTMILEDTTLPLSAPPPAPRLPLPGPPPPSSRSAPGTMILEMSAPSAAAAPVSTMPRSSFTGTLDGSHDSPISSLPFAKSGVPARRSDPPPAALPGAPWAGGPAPAKPQPARPNLSGTMTIDPDSDDAPTMFRGPPPAAPPPPAPPPPASPPPAEPSAGPPDAVAPAVAAPEAAKPPDKKPFVPRRRSDAYQKAVEKPPEAAPAPKPKPALPPKQDIGGALYRRKKP